jgi:hypothetical protein
MPRKHEDRLAELGLRPKLGHDLLTLFDWLSQKGLTDTGPVFDRPLDAYLPGVDALGERVVVAQSTSRLPCRPHTQQEIKDLKERFKNFSMGSGHEQLWRALRDGDGILRALSWQKLPPDAMAFYRPFHFPPTNQWGIYLLIRPLLNYHSQLIRQSDQSKIFPPEVLMHLILFEVFNHEFFHHLVESTATTLELLLATQDATRPVYLWHRLRQAAKMYSHPHTPLEEALANAYAYNALSFICRIKAGYKTFTVKTYQKAIEQYWEQEPAGYREAGNYIRENYVAGGAHLLAQLLDKPDSVNDIPLSVIARHVMPGGFSALAAKPEIPTWLVGDLHELDRFYELVPAPNEAYTQLFWPYNTEAFDRYIEEKLAEEKRRKTEQKMARMGHSAK